MIDNHIISSIFEEINALSEAEFAEELARHSDGTMALAFEEIAVFLDEFACEANPNYSMAFDYISPFPFTEDRFNGWNEVDLCALEAVNDDYFDYAIAA
jgi:hypothetical protein